MPSDIAISVKDLSKTFRIFDGPGSRIKQALTLGRVSFHKKFTALQNVSFEIERGESIGIIGRNGSGKSTLLQLVCGILKPSSGVVHVNGNVSALLELGSGFNPEFTGRENVYFHAAIMGIPKDKVAERFDEIAAFADIGDFIDEPTRIYSSGMFVRLAFAAAVSARPDILVIDEALAVGDASFRSRCFRRIGELRESGSTIIFVSHAMDQIVRTCNRTILLDAGELLTLGSSEVVVGCYQRLLSADATSRQAIVEQLRAGRDITSHRDQIEPDDFRGSMDESYDASIATFDPYLYEPNGAIIESIQILNNSGKRVNKLISGNCYCFKYKVRFLDNASNIRFATLILGPDGSSLGGAWSAPSSAESRMTARRGESVEVESKFTCMLNAGYYTVSVSVAARTGGVEFTMHGIKDAEGFLVLAKKRNATIASVDFCWETKVCFQNQVVN